MTVATAGEILALSRMAIVQGIRSRRFLILGLGLPLGMYFVYTVTGIGAAAGRSIDGNRWASYLMVSMAAFGAMNAAVSTAAGMQWSRRADSSGSVRINRDGASRRFAVGILAAMTLALLPVVMLLLLGDLGGVQLPASKWVGLVMALWLGALPFVALGLLLAPILDADTGDVVLLGLLVVLAILGGLFQPIDTFPTALAAVARVVPSYHLADLGWMAVARGNVDLVDAAALTGYLLGIGAIGIWRNWSEDRRVGV